MADILPKEELLRKMLNMTTSDNDGQALVAIRKANELLAAAGWSWDKLLAGKIKVIESPFKDMPNPSRAKQVEEPTATRPWQPQRSAPAPQSAPNPPPRPFARPRPGCEWKFDPSINDWVNSPISPAAQPPRNQGTTRGLGLTRTNMYANHCYCCGDYVPNNDGFIMKPKDFNSQAPDKWHIVCKSCNSNVSPLYVTSRPAMKQTGQTAVIQPVKLGDL